MLEFVVGRLVALLGPIATVSKDKRELKDSALHAISTALTETKLYYKGLEAGNPQNLETEAQLAKAWAAAAILLRHFDEELAMICEHKSEFWTSPNNWSFEQIEKAGISLENVSDAYRKLAMPKSYSRVQARG